MKHLLAVVGLVAAVPAAAQEGGPRFCPNEPSLESSACTVEPGHVIVEAIGADWILDKDAQERRDTFLFGGFQARVGAGPTSEVQVSWVPYGSVRTHDHTSGRTSVMHGVGDVRLAVRQNLQNADGSGLSFGIEPFATLPTGNNVLGAGTWGAGAVLPITYELNDAVTVGVTAELDAVPNEERRGRHFGGDLVAGVAVELSSKFMLTAETEALRDDEPAEHQQQWLASTGLQYKYNSRRALFTEVVASLNRDAPDVEAYIGVAALF